MTHTPRSLIPENGRPDQAPGRAGTPVCAICQDSHLVDGRTGMAWPLLYFRSNLELQMEIEEGLTWPEPCWCCSAPSHDEAHSKALELVRLFRLTGPVMTWGTGGRDDPDRDL